MRAAGATLVSVTVEAEVDDPVATVFASRLAARPLVRLGAARPRRLRARRARLRARGDLPRAGPIRRPDRRLRRRHPRPDRDGASPVSPPGPGRCGPGGFAFAPEAAARPRRGRRSRPRMLVLPELSLLRLGADHLAHVGRARLRRRRSRGGPRAARAAARVAARPSPCAMLDPHPAGATTIRSVSPPRHYEEIVAEATGRIRGGALDKVVLAREVAVEAPTRARSRGRVRRPARGLRLVLLLLRRLARGRVHRRQPGAPRPPSRRGRRHRRARRLDAAQRRPRGRRPSRRAAAAQRQEPRRASDRRPADRAPAGAALGLGRGRARAERDQGREHPAPGDGGARAARRAAVGGRARRAHAPDAGGRRRSRERSRSS